MRVEIGAAAHALESRTHVKLEDAFIEYTRGPRRPLSGRKSPQRAERPDEDRRDRDQDRREDDEERSEDGKAGAWADVSVGTAGKRQQDQRRQCEA